MLLSAVPMTTTSSPVAATCPRFSRPLVAIPTSQPSNLLRLRTFPTTVRCCRSIAANAKVSGKKAVFKVTGDKKVMEMYETELSVRDYELNKRGVVYDSMYSNYFQHGRQEGFIHIGFNADEIARKGYALAMADMSLNFIAPLRSGDKFVVRVKVLGCSTARVYLDHVILKLPNLEPIVEAKGTVVWLDKNYRPIRVPVEVRDELIKLFDLTP